MKINFFSGVACLIMLSILIFTSCKSSTERKIIGKWKLLNEEIVCTNPLKRNNPNNNFKSRFSLNDEMRNQEKIESAAEEIVEFYDNGKYTKMRKPCEDDCYTWVSSYDSMILKFSPDYSLKAQYQLFDKGFYKIRNDSLILFNEKKEEMEEFGIEIYSDNKIKLIRSWLDSNLFSHVDSTNHDYKWLCFYDKQKDE